MKWLEKWRGEDPPEFPDDWKPFVEHWHELTRCHCGNVRVNRGEPPAVCPSCGCRGPWIKAVQRYESERSLSRYSWLRVRCFPRVGVEYERNRRLVEWTPDHCKQSAGVCDE